MSSVQIIGGGLYGCLTAYHIAKKRPELRVDLIETGDHLLSAFDPITLAGIKFNNGFHGLELPRAKDLFDFISNELGTKMEIRPNQRGLAIKGHLIPFEAKLADWPDALQSLFVKGPGEILLSSDVESLISEEYRTYLRKIGSRYSDATKDIKGLLFPWFFPADYTIVSDDEGDMFRNAVRSGDLVASYGHPVKDLFNVLQADMENKLREVNVNIHFSTKVDFTPSGLEYEQAGDRQDIVDPKGSTVFYCASLAM